MVGPSDHRRFASAVQDRTPGGGALFSGGEGSACVHLVEHSEEFLAPRQDGMSTIAPSRTSRDVRAAFESSRWNSSRLSICVVC